MKKIIATLVALVALFSVTACTSDADMASDNIAKAAEQFEVQRSIVGVSGNDGSILFFAEGRCSFEYPTSKRVDVTCRYGPDEYRKHVFIMGERDSLVVTQEKPIDVSVYHTRIIIKPQNVIPAFDLEVGED